MKNASIVKERNDAIEQIQFRNDKTKFERFKRQFNKDIQLYILCIPAIVILLLFKFVPMYGNIIAFKRYTVDGGFWGSEWVGFKHFIRFFTGPYFWRTTRNTLLLGFWQVVIIFPAPIVLALLLNELRAHRFKKVVQTISYMPHFLSTVIIIGMMKEFVRNGLDLCISLRLFGRGLVLVQ